MEALAAALEKTSKKLDEAGASVGVASKKVNFISKRLQNIEAENEEV